MITINIDFDAFFELANLGDKVEGASRELAGDLGMATYAFILDKAEEKLHSSKALFLNSLSVEDDDGKGYEIKLDKNAAWIEEGLKPTDMLQFLIKSPHAKVSKDGSKYLNVPMDLDKDSARTSSQNSIASAVKSKIQQLGMSPGGSFKELFGKPGVQKIHVETPIKTLGPFGGIGQGSGAVGKPMQGQTGIPFLQGLQVRGGNKDSNDKNYKKGFIGTFRVASSKQEGKGLWQHPGSAPKHIFKEAREFMAQELIKRVRGT